jgi:hypothetical protein
MCSAGSAEALDVRIHRTLDLAEAAEPRRLPKGRETAVRLLLRC